VARFLGASNIIKGFSVAADRVSVADVAIRCVGAKPGANRARAIAVRPHDIRILVVPPADMGNVLPATITRNVFLGASRDYMVELADGTSLRVVAPPGENVPRGSKVWLHMPFTRCRMLRE
jgi:iron(III) transport system ATP-binding protein